jgi:tetratricopeptide (TPR) repeat protein
VNPLLIGLLGALLATNPAVAASNLLVKTTGVSVQIPDPNDPVEQEYRKLLEADDKAQADADGWIKDNQAFSAKGAGVESAVLNLKIEQRFAPVRKAYEDFLLRHPEHARARVAYGSMLGDLGLEDEALVQWEKARETDPKDPAIWNNLANHYGHRGPIAKAFSYYEKAIELKPDEPLYYQNLAVVVYLYRVDAQEYYKIDEARVFQKSLDLYRQAMKLAPKDFALAQDWAQTYYGIKPPRHEEALAAWNEVLRLAGDRLQEEGTLIHLARTEILLGRFQSASNRLEQVTNDVYQVLKKRVQKSLQDKQAKASAAATNETNSK